MSRKLLNGSLFRKNIQESVLLFAGCAALVAAFSFFRVWVVGRIDSGRFRQIIDLLPKDWERFSSVDFDWIVSYLGRTATTLDEPMLVLLVSAWAMVRGSDVVGGELGRGTMEMLLAQPVSRVSVYLHQLLVNVLGLVALCMICWLAMWAAVQITQIRESELPSLPIPLTGYRIPLPGGEPREYLIPMHEVVSASSFFPGICNLTCLGIFFAGMASLISSGDRYGWRATGISIGIYFVFLMLKIGSAATPFLAWMGWMTIFSLYEPELHVQAVQGAVEAFWHWTLRNPVTGGIVPGPLACNLSLLAGGLFLAVAGAVRFVRRDLPAPT